MNEFLYGCFGGVVGTIISHPVDTIRINLQSSKKPKYDVRSLYKGILSPFIGIGLEKAIVFGTYDVTMKLLQSNASNRVNENKKNSLFHFISGVSAGLSSTIVVTPVEYFKIKYQNQSSIKVKELQLKTVYRGWTATLFREVPGYGIYFYTYNKLTSYFGKNPYSIFMSGGMAGLTAWICIYPADYIKTRMQYYQTPFISTTKNIIKEKGFLGMYSGCSLALARAFILHCGVFTAYEYIKKLVD
tara:strand:+ start:7289 stop:8020 length:732 start_codon:yes stop_codon:yes gene_type:complete